MTMQTGGRRLYGNKYLLEIDREKTKEEEVEEDKRTYLLNSAKSPGLAVLLALPLLALLP